MFGKSLPAVTLNPFFFRSEKLNAPEYFSDKGEVTDIQKKKRHVLEA